MARSPDPLGAIVYVRAIVPVAESSLRHICLFCGGREFLSLHMSEDEIDSQERKPSPNGGI